jgi:hypothetical protein
MAWKIKRSPPDDRSSSGLLHALYPDTGESGDAYNTEVEETLGGGLEGRSILENRA